MAPPHARRASCGKAPQPPSRRLCDDGRIEALLPERSVLRRLLFFAIFSFGASTQVAHLVSRGSLWGDEAALALNIGPRDLFEMGRPFTYYQACPWLVMAAIKTSTLVLGDTELAYRLVPCLGAIAMLPLTYFLGRRVGGVTMGLCAMLFVATAAPIVYYAAELKQYTIDAVVAALLVLAFLRVLEAPGRGSLALLVLAVLGTVAGWASLPSLFVTGAICVALGLESLKHRRGARWMAIVAGLGALWLGSFVLHYQLFIAKSDLATSSNVVRYWSAELAPFPPDSFADLRWFAGKFFYVFEEPVDFGQRYVGGLAFIAGAIVLAWRRRVYVLVALLGPWGLALIASMMGRYPTTGRLMIFLVPALAVVTAASVTALVETRRRRVLARIAAVALLALLVVPDLDESYAHVAPARERLEMDDLLVHLGERRRPDDAVFMAEWDHEQIWEFYRERAHLPTRSYIRVRHLRAMDREGRYPNLPKLADAVFGRPRVWLIAPSLPERWDPKRTGRDAEAYATFITRYFERHGGRRLEKAIFGDIDLYLYDLSRAVPPVGPDATTNPHRGAVSSR